MEVKKVMIPLVSVLLVVGVVIGVVAVMRHDDKDNDVKTPVQRTVAAVCDKTEYKDSCISTLENVAKNSSATPSDYVYAVVEATLKALNGSLESTAKVAVDKDKDAYNYKRVEDCKAFLEDGADMLNEIISVVRDGKVQTLAERQHELWSWVTGVYSLQTTCVDLIDDEKYKSALDKLMENSKALTNNAVVILSELPEWLKLFNVTQQFNVTQLAASRRLMSAEDGYPSWFGAADRKLLAAGVVPDAVVAKDGSGKYKTVTEAIKAYGPKTKGGRYVIYVKAGVYNEQILVDKTKTNIFIYGDGIDKTIITASNNFAIRKTGTMDTATFGNDAMDFMARGITFRNDAGPEGHQAVAFRSKADRTALFDCSFEANQDTLYYQTNRQFYKNCRIYGTVDFIFGKGDCVIQDSEIIVRRPMPGQQITITADGRELPRGSNGLVIQNCRIVPDNFLYPIRFQVPTYLGRPWKKEALTVVMQSELGDFIRPEGWRVWDGESNHQSCEMYEYANRGPGARTDRREKAFKKFRVLAAPEAARFTAGTFLKAQDWLPQTGFPYRAGL